MVNFLCPLDWDTRHPDYTLFLVCLEVIADKMSV